LISITLFRSVIFLLMPRKFLRPPAGFPHPSGKGGKYDFCA
jgi:hypothetical protein